MNSIKVIDYTLCSFAKNKRIMSCFPIVLENLGACFFQRQLFCFSLFSLLFIVFSMDMKLGESKNDIRILLLLLRNRKRNGLECIRHIHTKKVREGFGTGVPESWL